MWSSSGIVLCRLATPGGRTARGLAQSGDAVSRVEVSIRGVVAGIAGESLIGPAQLGFHPLPGPFMQVTRDREPPRDLLESHDQSLPLSRVVKHTPISPRAGRAGE